METRTIGPKFHEAGTYLGFLSFQTQCLNYGLESLFNVILVLMVIYPLLILDGPFLFLSFAVE